MSWPETNCSQARVSKNVGTPPAVQQLRLRASNEGGVGSVPGPGTKIPRTAGLLSLRVTTREARLPPLRLNTGK